MTAASFTVIINLLTATYLFLIVFTMHTKNLKSSIIFKAIPFVCGLGLTYSGLFLAGAFS